MPAAQPTPRRSLLTLFLAAALIPTACASDDTHEEKKKSQGVAFDAMPLHPNAANLAEKGKELFTSRCTSCHGANGEGRMGIGPALASPSFLAAASDDFLIRTIKNGRAGTTMTAWGSILSDQEVSSIAAHIRSLAPHKPAELNEAPLAGDLETGQQVFETICSRCHGRNGGGYIESSSGTGIGRKVFLESVSDGYMRHIIKNGKDLTQMRSFAEDAPTAVANLDDKQIDSVISYLRKNAW